MRTGNDVKTRIAARSAWYGLVFLLLAGIAIPALGQMRTWSVARLRNFDILDVALNHLQA